MYFLSSKNTKIELTLKIYEKIVKQKLKYDCKQNRGESVSAKKLGAEFLNKK